MTYYIVKIVLTTLLIVVISEISKRSSFIGAILASVPLISVLAMLWLYIDTKDISRVTTLSQSIFWLVLPSLVLFITLPILLRQGVHFYLAMTIAICLTIFCYWLMVTILQSFGVRL